MTTTLPAVPEGGAFATLAAATTAADRYAAGQAALELISVPGMTKPAPKFMFDLPWAEDDDAAVADILARLAAAEDITDATAEKDLRKVKDIAGQDVTILDLRVRPSDVEDSDWGCYLSLAVSVDGGPQEVINTGAAQVAVVLWRCWCEGRFPVTGQFRLLGQAKPGRSQPVGFRVDDPAF